MFIRTESLREFIRYYPAVSTIVTIHLLLYLLTVLPIFPNNWFIETFSGVNLYITEGEYWRLLTPTFMHSGFTHMLFNSFSIVLFGPTIEKWLGSFKFFSLYLVCGIAANLGTLFLEPLSYTHVGSSGAIFGLFGFYIAIIMYRKNWISRDNSRIILILLAISIVMTFLQPNINVTSHFVGLLSGYIIGALSYFNRKDFNLSISEAAKWASSRKSSFSRQSPVKIIVWGVILLFAVLGFMIQR